MKTFYFYILTIFLLIACGRNTVRIPTITEDQNGNYLYGKIVWHDLITDNIPVARDFYSEMFGWEFEGRGGDGAPYLTAYYNDRPIAGLVKSDRLEEEVNESRWISYFSVPDVDRVFGIILNSGGLIYKAPMDLDVRGRLAIVGDNKGASFGIITANGGDPEDRQSARNTWIWDELITSDPGDVIELYSALAGYEIQDVSSGGYSEHYILLTGDKQRAGITTVPWQQVHPNWLPYILVEDINSMITRAENLGARLIVAPDQNIQNGTIAILADPSGAVFGMQAGNL